MRHDWPHEIYYIILNLNMYISITAVILKVNVLFSYYLSSFYKYMSFLISYYSNTKKRIQFGPEIGDS